MGADTYNLRLEPAGIELAGTTDVAPLTLAMNAGFQLKHSCRRGECNSCTAKIISGSVTHPAGTASVPDGHCLTCCAQPQGDLVLDTPEVTSTPGVRVQKTIGKITDKITHHREVVILRLAVPAQVEFKFKAGQYIDILLRTGERRSYSIANAENQDGQLELHIKVLEGGKFSNAALDKLKPRTVLKIEGPFGSFNLDQKSNKPIVMLATGTGLAPILSILRTHQNALEGRKVDVFWGLRTLDQFYLPSVISQWEQEFPNIALYPVLSQPSDDWQGLSGYVQDHARQQSPDLSNHQVYACGNAQMTEAARKLLTTSANLPEAEYFSDAFLPS
ncbi:MAG: FAD-binding oxidoreductase [Natronospirillum sp.]